MPLPGLKMSRTDGKIRININREMNFQKLIDGQRKKEYNGSGERTKRCCMDAVPLSVLIQNSGEERRTHHGISIILDHIYFTAASQHHTGIFVLQESEYLTD